MITSLNNIYIKELIKIINEKSSDSFCVVEGIRSIETFMESNLYKLKNLFISEEFYANYCNNNLLILERHEKLISVSNKIMKKISKMTTAPGIIGIFEKNYDINFKNLFCESTYILYNINNPGNLGTIIRTAVALDRSYIILIDGCHYHNLKVVQSTAGNLAKIKIFRIKLNDFILNFEQEIIKRNISIFALDAGGESILDFKKEILNNSYLLIGNEANGISDTIKKRISKTLSLPMSEKCESLNASIAAALAGYKCWSNL